MNKMWCVYRCNNIINELCHYIFGLLYDAEDFSNFSPPPQEAAWTISNITVGQPNQIQAVIDMGLIPPLVQIMVKVGHHQTD